jgi:hypothetical protein
VIPASEADAGRDGKQELHDKGYYGQGGDGRMDTPSSMAGLSPEQKVAFMPGSRGSEFARSPPPQELPAAGPGGDWTQYNRHGELSS